MIGLYVMSILDNIHSLSSIGLTLLTTAIFISTLAYLIEKPKITPEIKNIIKYVLITYLVCLVCYIVTPRSFKHDMDMKYINQWGEVMRENNTLRHELRMKEHNRDF